MGSIRCDVTYGVVNKKIGASGTMNSCMLYVIAINLILSSVIKNKGKRCTGFDVYWCTIPDIDVFKLHMSRNTSRNNKPYC